MTESAPQVALVVGASSGIGRAVADALAGDGLRVYGGARSFSGDGEVEISWTALPMDVTDGQAVRRAVERVLEREGRIDILVYCAAQIVLGALEDLEEGDLARVLDVNLRGAARCVRAVLPGMRARRAGTLVFLSSINGLLATPFTGAYVASKHALEGYAEALAMELAPCGIRVMRVRPGDHRGGSQRCRRRQEACGEFYRKAYASAAARIARDEAQGLDPEDLARGLVRRLRGGRPPQVWTVARWDQRLMVLLHKALPAAASGWIVRRYYTGRTGGAPKP